MLSLFRKGPKFVDSEFVDLSLMLAQDDENPTYKRELLSKTRLDMSIESLHHLDSYLEVLHQNPPEGKDFSRVVLRCGAYVGEVMRRQQPGRFHWIAPDEAAKYSQTAAGFGESLATAGILWENSESMCFPLAKICKFIDNGNEDSVYFFAKVLLEQQ
jgi:hypothetical protein